MGEQTDSGVILTCLDCVPIGIAINSGFFSYNEITP